MLVNLTPIPSVVEELRKIAKDHNLKYFPQSDIIRIIETGIYISAWDFNFLGEEFEETKGRNMYGDDFFSCVEPKNPYGVADNIEQIKEYYKEEIEDPDRKFFIYVTPVHQNKSNKGEGDGWRWRKWGPYIGNLNPKCEYLDDEDFGEDFNFVLVFVIQPVC